MKHMNIPIGATATAVVTRIEVMDNGDPCAHIHVRYTDPDGVVYETIPRPSSAWLVETGEGLP